MKLNSTIPYLTTADILDIEFVPFLNYRRFIIFWSSSSQLNFLIHNNFKILICVGAAPRITSKQPIYINNALCELLQEFLAVIGIIYINCKVLVYIVINVSL